MPNDIERISNTEPTNGITVEEKVTAIRQRAEDMVAKASLQLVRERMPEYVPVVEQLVAEMDIHNPLSLAKTGSWALEEQAEAGIELLRAVQQGPNQQALAEIDAFEARLRERVQPLEERLKERNKKLTAKKSPLSQMFTNLGSIFKSKKSKRSDQTQEIQKDMDGLRADDALLVNIVEKTIEDTSQMNRVLGKNKDVPAIIEQQVEKALDTHADAALKLFLSLAAVNEKQNALRTNDIPDMEEKAMSPDAIDTDIDTLQRAKSAVGLLETRRTDIMAAFLNTCVQRGMIAEMGRINASSSIEMERLANIALPQMLSMLGTLALQQRTGELVAGTIYANRILGEATKSTSKGFEQVLQLSMEADKAKLGAADSVVKATTDTLKALRNYREHEAGHIERQRAVQERLVQSVGELRVAAARIGSSKNQKMAIADKKETDALALQATGVNLAEQRVAQQPEEKPTVIAAQKPEVVTVTEMPPRPKAEELFKQAQRRGPKKTADNV